MYVFQRLFITLKRSVQVRNLCIYSLYFDIFILSLNSYFTTERNNMVRLFYCQTCKIVNVKTDYKWNVFHETEEQFIKDCATAV